VPELTRTIIHKHPDGTCSLVAVPFTWSAEDPLPGGAPDRRYETAAAAMTALAAVGRAQQSTLRLTRAQKDE
jgi:hypothetical protein